MATRHKSVQTALAAMLLATSAGSWAQADKADEQPVHPWVAPAPSREPESYFTNLKEGDVRETPFVAKFGLSRRGLVPAGKTVGRAGHHHLLIDQRLPLDFKKPLPFNDKYIHFGKGQMEGVINLPPGSYDLRLVLADKDHIPYFVYSKPLKLTVSRQSKNIDPASVLGTPHIELLNLADSSTVRPPFRLQFHASGYNVAHMAAQVPGTGHFRLMMERLGQKTEVLDFAAGQTESWFRPPPGDYSLRLALVANAPGEAMMSESPPLALVVAEH